ncbi:MAG TPA: efflux RND transporter periplasmic adaptor subunit [Saprospiraceae bacterium]|nr:efflux RND transporter periplasmic adaptor subunit [Saprospiraceae bacterium]HMP25615.1 efflux RND transporter periplasmic adaptor subunit [Saprospiraceae bacterium]
MAKQKKRNNWLVIGLVSLILVLIVAAVVKQRATPKGELVDTEKVARRTITERVAASGKVFPQTEVKISSDVSGEIVALYVEEGDSVVAGQLLAKVDPEAVQSQVERGVASVNSAKAQLANSRSQIEQLRAQRENIVAQLRNAREIHQRNEQLRKEGVISQADYDQSLSNLQALEANLRSADAQISAGQESAKAAAFQVESAEASLRELRTSLRRTTIYAPTGGIISRLSVEQGERVVGTIQMTGTEMMRIANLNAMEVRVDVSENDIPRVTIGDEVDIEVEAYIGRKFKGRVTQIARSASGSTTGVTTLSSDQVTNFEVRISVDPSSYQDLIQSNKRYPFLPGMSASVEINTETVNNALCVPIQAVTTRERDKDKRDKAAKAESEDADEEEGKAVAAANTPQARDSDLMEVVFVVSEGKVKMVEVKTGIQDDSYIHITSGLQEGQEIVTGPYTAISRKLKDGDQIRSKKDSENKKKSTE